MKTPETFTAENEAFTVLISKEDDFYKVRITSNDSVPESLNPLPVAIMGRKGKSMVDTSLNLKSIPSDNRSYEGLYPSPYNGYEAKSIEIQLKDGNQTLSLQPVKPNED